ncbi:MAG TPA: glycosyl hydrolase [Thermoanaerobaculia bacterium]|nr:glycosyl hydrolase [Thermoanaerobaculia bacterium]
MTMRRWGFAAAALLAALPVSAAKVDSAALSGFRARSIGPAAFGGRIEAIDASAKNPKVIWIGAAGGGVWKSIDGGVSYKPVFDKYSQSIGALAVDQAHPDTVWVGTGEGDTRNSVSVGSGIYRTDDGGDDWKLMGLGDSERIARIAIDPADSNVVFAAVLGRLWSDSAERGVYRTADGGKTWQKLLFVNASTGCSDIAIDPKNPKRIYAAMWDFRRSPDFFRSGGPGSGLWRSLDGGAHWTRLTAGLPSGDLGRIAIGVAPSRPETVYATVESAHTALYRSDDAGDSWKRVNTSFNVGVRPFYFSHLSVDPRNPDRVYKPGFVLTVSEDGGKTFSGGAGFDFGSYHSDTHALWIDPANSDHLMLGTDGGVYVSWDRGGRWLFQRTLPVSQPYRVALDDARPFRVYGGFQDNGCWYGPSGGAGGIGNDAWKNYGFGDGMYTFPDPADPDVLYWEYQGGEIYKYFQRTRETKQIRPYPAPGEATLRFNWESPLVVSPADPHLLLAGAQYLFASTDQGESWKRISGDLTTNDPKLQRQVESGGITPDDSSAENHCTIYAIGASPLDRNLIWAGTDDGNLQVTRDGGGHWQNVVGNVPGLPKGTWVSGIEPSRFDKATVYATFDGHARGDFKTYAYRSRDFGATWEPLATADVAGYAHVLREDPKSASLLYLGTEQGLFLSIDGGREWAEFTGGLPRVPVRDIAIHPRDSDLVLATHGRGFWIVDDVSPLRQLTPEVLAADVAVLEARPTWLRIPEQEQSFKGDGDYVGENPPDAAAIYFWRGKRRLMGDSRIEIADASGKTIATLPGSNRKGINRVMWNPRLKPPKTASGTGLAVGALFGPTAPVGTYTVKVIDGDKTYSGKLVLAADPLLPHTAGDIAARQDALMRLYAMQEDLAFLADSVAAVRDQASERAGKLGRTALGRRAEDLSRRLDALSKTLATSHPPLEGMPADADRQLREWITDLFGAINGFGGKPSAGQLAQIPVLGGRLDAARRDYEKLTGTLPELNRDLAKKSLPPIDAPSRERWEKQQKS